MRHNGSRIFLLSAVVSLLVVGCQTNQERENSQKAALKPAVDYPIVGKIERFDPAAEAMLPTYTRIEKVAQGFKWAEGPVWWPERQSLLFTDVPANAVLEWREPAGLRVFLKRSGYTGPDTRSGEPGANGLALDPQGRLVLCQQGDRRVSRVTASGRYKPVAAYYKFLRFNSPNDLVFHSNGDLYFTDPTYGLEGGDKDPKREIVFNGVYRVTPAGDVTAVVTDLTKPNGVALAPGERVLYVAVSDPDRPVIMAYPLNADGSLGKGRVFFDAKQLVDQGRKGLPDGLKTDVNGNVFATGPGGVLVISPQGRLLAIIDPGAVVANCAWGNDGTVLYMAATDSICRVRTYTSGFGFAVVKQ